MQTEGQVENKESRLAEVSFSMYVDLSLYRNNIKRVKVTVCFLPVQILFNLVNFKFWLLGYFMSFKDSAFEIFDVVAVYCIF